MKKWYDYIDMTGPTLSLSYYGKNSYKTSFGAIVTIACLALTMWYMWGQVTLLVERTDPSFTYNEFYWNLTADIPANLTAG